MTNVKKNAIIGLIGFLTWVLGLLSKTTYRSYMINNDVNDYGISGFLPSFFYVIGFALLLLFNPVKNSTLIIIIVTLGSIIYELYQSYRNSKLDLNDIAASILGGVTAFIIIRLVTNSTNLKN